MNNELIPTNAQENSVVEFSEVEALGEAANQAASLNLFSKYRDYEISDNTRIRQDRDLVLFAEYWKEYRKKAKIRGEVGDLAGDPQAWKGVTWGLVEGFRNWLLQSGYAATTVNIRMSTIKVYSKLAYQVDVISSDEYMRIAAIRGYKRKVRGNVDEQRKEQGTATRIGNKKAEAITLQNGNIAKLKNQPDTPQGRRDALLIAIMVDYGLRVGELSELELSHFDLEEKTLTFYRRKVDKDQTIDLTQEKDTMDLVSAWLEHAPSEGSVWRGSRKIKAVEGEQRGSELTGQGMSTRAITKRVRLLGKRVLGIENLSAHDLRHTWATRAARSTPIDKLMEAGGWSSYAMPLRYIEAAKLANEGVILE